MAEADESVEILGKFESVAELARRRLNSGRIIARILEGDYRVWSDDHTEISDRLGWLTLPDDMGREISALTAFAEEIRAAGFRHVVLLGMGGSSLGPEVLRRTFGRRDGYPELLVLDSTLPAWIRAVDDIIEPASALFLVSSKSGSTIEPNVLYSYYRQRVADALGEDQAGANFVAITDAGTSLEELGNRQSFRRIFRNPPDIGGRYSVLSFFGLVPAALIGVNLEELLGRAAAMGRLCARPDADRNPGARLGAVAASLAQAGRDKLTLITSPALAGFGLWVEQLLAESLGKDGQGIIPVAGEPALAPDAYGSDRLIVYLQLLEDDNRETDALVESLKANHPIVRIPLIDRYELGREFYRWEFATAVAGHILAVHPFNQPDVQGAKDMTDRVLEVYAAHGALADLETGESPAELLENSRAGDYLSILAYLPDTPQIEAGINRLRRNITERYGIPTTAGYGPRYLHSTGQLHKGGPGSGIFLLLTADPSADVPIPRRRCSFSVLAQAQAVGDMQMLQALGRRTAAIDLGAAPADRIMELAQNWQPYRNSRR